jgi:hypothetical protein
MKERDYMENIGLDGKIMLREILKKSVERAWSGLIWLRIRTGGRFFYTPL